MLQASARGVFELKLRSFENSFGLDDMDACCSGGKTSRGVCVNECATKFRVCLMHYQRVIDEHPSCTFGEATTPVLGRNTFKIAAGSNASFVNPIVFPFNFSWPVSTPQVMFSRVETCQWSICHYLDGTSCVQPRVPMSASGPSFFLRWLSSIIPAVPSSQSPNLFPALTVRGIFRQSSDIQL